MWKKKLLILLLASTASSMPIQINPVTRVLDCPRQIDKITCDKINISSGDPIPENTQYLKILWSEECGYPSATHFLKQYFTEAKLALPQFNFQISVSQINRDSKHGYRFQIPSREGYLSVPISGSFRTLQANESVKTHYFLTSNFFKEDYSLKDHLCAPEMKRKIDQKVQAVLARLEEGCFWVAEFYPETYSFDLWAGSNEGDDENPNWDMYQITRVCLFDIARLQNDHITEILVDTIVYNRASLGIRAPRSKEERFSKKPHNREDLHHNARQSNNTKAKTLHVIGHLLINPLRDEGIAIEGGNSPGMQQIMHDELEISEEQDMLLMGERAEASPPIDHPLINPSLEERMAIEEENSPDSQRMIHAQSEIPAEQNMCVIEERVEALPPIDHPPMNPLREEGMAIEGGNSPDKQSMMRAPLEIPKAQEHNALDCENLEKIRKKFEELENKLETSSLDTNWQETFNQNYKNSQYFKEIQEASDAIRTYFFIKKKCINASQPQTLLLPVLCGHFLEGHKVLPHTMIIKIVQKILKDRLTHHHTKTNLFTIAQQSFSHASVPLGYIDSCWYLAQQNKVVPGNTLEEALGILQLREPKYLKTEETRKNLNLYQMRESLNYHCATIRLLNVFEKRLSDLGPEAELVKQISSFFAQTTIEQIQNLNSKQIVTVLRDWSLTQNNTISINRITELAHFLAVNTDKVIKYLFRCTWTMTNEKEAQKARDFLNKHMQKTSPTSYKRHNQEIQKFFNEQNTVTEPRDRTRDKPTSDKKRDKEKDYSRDRKRDKEKDYSRDRKRDKEKDYSRQDRKYRR